jgi:hypothetical protein
MLVGMIHAWYWLSYIALLQRIWIIIASVEEVAMPKGFMLF